MSKKLRHLVTLLTVAGILPGTGEQSRAQDYWQQELKYTIKVKLDDRSHAINADETIEYINNSPDELTLIYMHLWPNAYKNRSTALVKQQLENGDDLLYYARDEDRGYIDSLDFRVDGEPVKWEFDPGNIDICLLTLNKPLKSGGRIVITTPFHVKFPLGVFSRLGHIGESYQVTQWYPKPAVYDKNGWNPMPYLDQGEFYSEFGAYDVYISLPKNYMVGATGDLVDGEDEIQWLEEQVEASRQYVAGLEKPRLPRRTKEPDIDELSFPASDSTYKTLHYHQSRVHDFGWFADKRWHVLKGEVELPHSKRKVDTWVMFTDEEAYLWKEAVAYVNDAVYYYSLWNGDYPYRHATAVDGALSAGGGMEYPNVTVIGTSGSAFGLETVIMHEVGHNWFYGILGSNERSHPWMDEGLNSFNENRYIETKYPQSSLLGGRVNLRGARILDIGHFGHKDTYYLGYLLNARRRLDQPIELKSADYSMINYGVCVYGKTALVFDYLMAYLGNDAMDKAMQAYFEQWKFKHPQPEDLRQVLEEETGKDLTWFFDNMVNGVEQIDYKITGARNNNTGYTVKIKNITHTEVPFSLSGIINKEAVNTTWYEGFSGSQEIQFPEGDYDALKIDFSEDIPEVNRRNNTFNTGGMLHRAEPFRLQFLASLENSGRSQLFWLPVMGWNEYDHLMPGLAIYGSVMPPRNFEYAFMPLYSSSTNTVLGSGMLGYTWYPEGTNFQNIRLSLGGGRYSNGSRAYESRSEGLYRYPVQANKLKAGLGLTLKNNNPRSKVVNRFLISKYELFFRHSGKGRQVNEQVADVTVIPGMEADYYINRLAFSHRNGRTLNPYSFGLSVEQGSNFVKGSVEGAYKISYRRGSGLDIRLYSGRFLYNDFPKVADKFAFSLDGNRDYLYDHVLPGRAEADGLLAAQFVRNEGGFKNAVNMDHAQTWLSAANLQTSTLPKLPVSLYADIGWSSARAKELVVGTGAALVLLPNMLEIYFPFYTSTGIPFPQYEKNIRFVFNIAALNPFELLTHIPH